MGNITLVEELDQWPYDPKVPLPPPHEQTVDWRTEEKPYPATVVASPASYEVSEDEGHFLILAGRENRTTYRLKQDAADKLGVVPEWYPGWHDDGEPEGTVTFSQPWKERALVLP